MEANADTGPTVVSLAEVISAAKEAYRKGEELDECINLLWKKMYEAVPALDYSTEEQTRDRVIQGSPDVCNALAESLVKNGLPDCIQAHRLARPVFWLMHQHKALVPLQRNEIRTCSYLWYPARKNYRRMKSKYLKAFSGYLPYLRANLQIVLEASKTYK